MRRYSDERIHRQHALHIREYASTTLNGTESREPHSLLPWCGGELQFERHSVHDAGSNCAYRRSGTVGKSIQLLSREGHWGIGCPRRRQEVKDYGRVHMADRLARCRLATETMH